MRKKNWLLIGIIVTVVFAIGVLIGGRNYSTNLIENNDVLATTAYIIEDYGTTYPLNGLEKIAFLFDHLLNNSHFTSDYDDLIRGAIQGMVDASSDPWAILLEDNTMQDWIHNRSFDGLGIQSQEIDGYVIIRDIIVNSSAERVGLLPGDAILSVDGVNVNEAPLGSRQDALADKLPNTRGMGVVLGVQRGNELLYIDATILNTTVSGVISDIIYYNESRIGYLRIPNWNLRTDEFTLTFLRQFRNDEVDGIVLDLRNNGGGSLDPVYNLLDELLPAGTRSFSEIFNGVRHPFIATGRPASMRPWIEVDNVVILVNGATASASEIFTIGIMDSIGWDVVGTTTFGKGTRQNSTFKLGSYRVQLTVSEYFRRNGNRIENYGITPTIYVETSELFALEPLHLSLDTVLVYDTVDNRTLRAQLILESLSYEIIRTDGYFDNSTVLAVQSFQQDNGLTVTGTLNAETSYALSLALSSMQQNPFYDNQLLTAMRLLATTGSE